MSLVLRSLGILLLVAAFQWPAAAKDLEARITIRVIYAVGSTTRSVDPALDDLRSELVALPFTKFRLLDKLQADVTINSTVELQFPGERSIAVRFLGLDVSGDKDMLSLQLSVKPRLNMQLRVADGGRTLLGGPNHLDGTLFLDVTAKLQDIDAAKPAARPGAGEPAPLEAGDKQPKESLP
jgi:hypothetical protein